jgi:hypothetical protein
VSAGNLTLSSTGHATKGKIFFGAAAVSYYDEAAGSLFIKRNSFTDGLRIENNGFTTNALSILNSGAVVASWKNYGALAVGDGSQAAPTYTFNSESTTGFYWPGSGFVDVSCSGLLRTRFGKTGSPHLNLFATANSAQQSAASFTATFPDATATYKGRITVSVSDSAGTREVFRGEANGSAPLLSFFGGAAQAKPTVTGSRGGNAALASLLTALAGFSLITDSSSA